MCGGRRRRVWGSPMGGSITQCDWGDAAARAELVDALVADASATLGAVEGLDLDAAGWATTPPAPRTADTAPWSNAASPGSHATNPAASPTAAPPPSPEPPRNVSAGRCGTPPGASSAAGAARPSAYPPTTPPHRTSRVSTTTSPPSTDTAGEGHKNITTATTNHPAGLPHAPPHRPHAPNNTPPTPNTPPKDPNKNQTTPKTILMNNQG